MLLLTCQNTKSSMPKRSKQKIIREHTNNVQKKTCVHDVLTVGVHTSLLSIVFGFDPMNRLCILFRSAIVANDRKARCLREWLDRHKRFSGELLLENVSGSVPGRGKNFSFADLERREGGLSNGVSHAYATP